jgi:hypothetical protein
VKFVNLVMPLYALNWQDFLPLDGYWLIAI